MFKEFKGPRRPSRERDEPPQRRVRHGGAIPRPEKSSLSRCGAFAWGRTPQHLTSSRILTLTWNSHILTFTPLRNYQESKKAPPPPSPPPPTVNICFCDHTARTVTPRCEWYKLSSQNVRAAPAKGGACSCMSSHHRLMLLWRACGYVWTLERVLACPCCATAYEHMAVFAEQR